MKSNNKGAPLGIIFIAALMLSLLSIVLIVPITNAVETTPYTDSIPTAPPVGGEYVPVNVLQLLAPYLIVAFLGAAAIAALILYKKAAS